jgi:hypothetical protein
MSEKDHADLFPLFAQAMVDDLGVILCADAGQKFTFGFRDPQAFEGVLDGFRYIIPTLALLRRRA